MAPFAGSEGEVDEDFAALAAPSRTRSLAGMALMATVMLLSGALMVLHLADLRYFLFASSRPRELGAIDAVSAGSLADNDFVEIEGMPLAGRAVHFRRLGSSGDFRVYPMAGQAKVFVERFTPDGTARGRAAPHGVYRGRLIHFSKAGGGYRNVRTMLEQMGTPVPDDAWLLIDGEAPGTRYWSVALFTLLLFFFGFNAVCLVRYSRPIRD